MDTDISPTERTTTLPTPSHSSRWRWSTTRQAALCGGALMGALAFGGVAGAATTHPDQPAAHGNQANSRGTQPTAGGKITALSGDDITIATRDSTATVVYSDTTTFKTRSGTTTTAADLKVGEFITAHGTKASNGDVTATSIMIGTGPPGHGGPPGKGGPPKGGPGPGTAGR